MPGEATGIGLMPEQFNLDEAPLARLIARAQSGDTSAFDEADGDARTPRRGNRVANARQSRGGARTRLRKHFSASTVTSTNSIASGTLQAGSIESRSTFVAIRRESAAGFGPIGEIVEAETLASNDDTEAGAVRSQQRTLVLKALSSLSEKERAALVLRDLEGLATEEVARILGSTPTTVRSQISSARVKIRNFRDRFLHPARKEREE
jgi:RNA polymerase sigma-70 factor (ECF subfamily)